MRCPLVFALSTAVGTACGGSDEVAPAVPDASVTAPDASFYPLCSDGDPVTITGSTPRGTVDDLDYLNVPTLGGFCSPRVTLVFTDQPAHGFPAPTPRLEVVIDVPELAGTPLSGDFTAIVRHTDPAGESETTGTFTAEAIEPLGTDGTGVRGTLAVEGGGWALALAVDAAYCDVNTCL